MQRRSSTQSLKKPPSLHSTSGATRRRRSSVSSNPPIIILQQPPTTNLAYSYYRQLPGWGTQQYQFAPPPTPNFHPEATWGGREYYRAAAVSPDLSIYESVWDRVRTGAAGVGMGFNDARHCHRSAYGGLGNVATMAPSELGAAAGYEAYRTWIHNSDIHEPLTLDDERQREALVGLAVAEATRLWNTAGRRMDRHGLQATCDAAGATASHIIVQWSQNNYSPGLPTSYPINTNPYLNDEAHSRHSRSSHRHGRQRRHSSVGPSPAPSVINVGRAAGSGEMRFANETINMVPYPGTSHNRSDIGVPRIVSTGYADGAAVRSQSGLVRSPTLVASPPIYPQYIPSGTIMTDGRGMPNNGGTNPSFQASNTQTLGQHQGRRESSGSSSQRMRHCSISFAPQQALGTHSVPVPTIFPTTYRI